MVNASLGSNEDMFHYFGCSKEIHIGNVWDYIAAFLCFLLGTPAHSWNLWLILHVKIKPTQVFPLILTAVELFFCIESFANILNIFFFMNITCASVILFFFAMSWTCRLLIQMCICIEQYLAVLYPVAFLRYKSIHYRMAPVAAIFIITAAYSVFLSIGFIGFPDVVFVFTSFTVMLVILYCYVSVLHALRHTGLRGQDVTGYRDVRNQQKRNASNTISAGLFIILLSYLPLIAIGIFKLMNMETVLLQCDVVPVLLSINKYSVVVPPLWKLYKGHFKNERERNCFCSCVDYKE